jgi:TonB family protein
VREQSGREQNERAGPRRPPSGLRAVLEAFRSIPERLRRPESLLMLLALFASVGVHMPPYLGLGALADYFESQERARPKEEPLPPVEFELNEQPKAEPAPNEPTEPEPEKPKPERKKREPEKKIAKPEPEKQEEPKPAELAVTQPPPEPLPPQQNRKQSITQKSEDPNVEPPPDAKYLAEESRRVEEETVAAVTSETKDDPNPNAAAPQDDGPEKAGDSRDDERGAMKGARDEQQQQAAARQRREEALPRPQQPAQPAPTPPQTARSDRRGSPQPERAETPAEVVVRDPLGSFVLAPSNPSTQRGGAREKSTQGSGQKAPSIKVSWRAFEQTFGAEQLAQDRMPREARRRGAGREKRWDEFRAAIENYVVGVKTGNSTALNAAADPFAAYLAAFHRNLHMEFAHDFLASLPMAGDLGNPALVTKVEIVVNPDGSLDRVGVVKSSGNLMYDFGAFNAVQRGAPYPPPPEKIRSPDGRVYMRWALHRNESQCGTWNAEPYILKTPPRSPNDPKQDNVSPYRHGGDTGQRDPRDEPKRAPSETPAVAPGETLGRLSPRRTHAG